MKRLEDVIHYIDISIDKVTLMTYINLKWVRPVCEEDVYYFEDIDVERVRLIYLLQNQLMIEDSAMDLVLSLLDQLYGARTQMTGLMQAITAQPTRVQNEILSFIKKKDK